MILEGISDSAASCFEFRSVPMTMLISSRVIAWNSEVIRMTDRLKTRSEAAKVVLVLSKEENANRARREGSSSAVDDINLDSFLWSVPTD